MPLAFSMSFTRWQDTKWLTPSIIYSSSTGFSALQRSSHSGQRGWKVQPEGGFAGDGTSPCSGIRFFFFVTSATGIALSSALV